jgi:protein-S-isoprenylcysteine O-methyltransferase Ste14
MPENVTLDPMFWIVFCFVMAGWFVFAIAFVLRKRPETSSGRIRNNRSIRGVLLMGVGMALVWWVRRPVGVAFIPISLAASYLLDFVACTLTVGSIWLILAAIRLLGKQWNVMAMVVEHHQLIATGPYSFVRHPIYTGMFGLMLATGIANGYWYSLLAAIGFAVVGTFMRIREEEQLLRDTFGADFDAYQKTVPAFFPRLH